jgi:hypothetical protein
MFCGHCGNQVTDGFKFCPSCGKTMDSAPITDSTGKSIEAPTPKIDEKIYFQGEGELVIKKIEHRGAGRKIASWLVAGPIGYLAFGRDKTKKSKAQGMIVITQKGIYCAGNEYPFDKILSVTKSGSIHKSVLVNFQSDVSGERYSIDVEIKTKEIDRLFAGLESAKMSKLGF